MKRILSVFIVILCFFSQSAFAAAPSIEIQRAEVNPVENSEEQNLTIEGSVAAGSKNTTVFLLNPGKTETDLENATALTMADVVNYLWQPQLAQDNSFEFTFNMNGDKGYYTIVATADGWDSWYVHPTKIWYSSAQDIRDAIDAVNGVTSGDNTNLESVLFDVPPGSESNATILGLYQDTYNSLSADKKAAAMDYALSYVFTQRSKLTADAFTSAGQIKDAFAAGTALYCFNNGLVGKRTLVENKQNALGIAEHASWKIFDEKLNVTQQDALLGSLSTYTSADTLKTAFIEKVVISGVKNLSHSDISDVFEAGASVLTSMNLSTYQSLTDTSAIDKAIVGNDYTIASLCSTVNGLLSPGSGGDGGDGGGSGSSGGSGGNGRKPSSEGANSFTYDTPQENTPQITPATGFTDMTDAQWAVEAVNALAKAGIINGRNANTFDPHATVTREEFMKMLVLTFGLETGDKSEFSDVHAGSWYEPYVAAAYNSGIVNGIGDNLFGTGMPIKRQDMATMIYNAAKHSGMELSAAAGNSFADEAEISEYAKEGVYALSSNQIINGMGDNVFAPLQTSTRAQASKVLYEITKLLSAQKGV